MKLGTNGKIKGVELEGMDSMVTLEESDSEDEMYKVTKIPNPVEREELINGDDKMPVHPFYMLLVGPRKMGKSNTLIDFLVTKVPPNFFDLTILYCKTYEDDLKWSLLTETMSPDFIHKKMDLTILDKEYETVCKVVKDNPNFRTLMIFDDMISDNVTSRYSIDMVGKLAVMGRHKGISVCFTTQLFKALGTAIRNNATNILVFQQGNSQELDKISEECRGALSKKDFLRIYNKIFENADDKPFLHINRDRPLQYRFTKGWGQQFYVENGNLDLNLKDSHQEYDRARENVREFAHREGKRKAEDEKMGQYVKRRKDDKDREKQDEQLEIREILDLRRKK